MDRKNDIPENTSMPIAITIYIVFTVCVAFIVCGGLIFLSNQHADYDREVEKSRRLNNERLEQMKEKHQHLKNAIRTGDYSRYFPND